MRLLRNGFLTTAVVALSALGAAAGAATAASFEQVGGDLSGAAHGDGDRWVAYAIDLTTVQAFDEVGGTTHQVPIPCATTPGRDPLLAVGGGQAIVGCARAGGIAPRPLRLDLAAGTWHEIPGIDALQARYERQSLDHGLQVTAVGARWLAAVASGHHYSFDLAIDWRSGALGPEPTSSTAPDLDAAPLNVPLCSPLARTPERESIYSDLPAFEAMQYDAPFAVSNGSATPLTLRRCDSAASTTLQPAPSDTAVTGTTSVQLSGGVVSWLAQQARLHLPACALRLSWPRAEGWLHTTRSLYRSAVGDDGLWTVERTALPTCASAARAIAARVVIDSRLDRAGRRQPGRSPRPAGRRPRRGARRPHRDGALGALAHRRRTMARGAQSRRRPLALHGAAHAARDTAADAPRDPRRRRRPPAGDAAPLASPRRPHRDRHPRHGAEVAGVVADLDVPQPRRAAAVERSRVHVDRAGGDRAQEAGAVGEPHRVHPLLVHAEVGAHRRERLGDGRVEAAVDEPERLQQVIPDRYAGAHLPVAVEQLLIAEEAVEAVFDGRQRSEAHAAGR
jgi:hypothetical protein